MTFDLSLRPATTDDAHDLARLINLAGDGLPRYFWSQMRNPDQSDWEYGAARARRETGGFSYHNSTIATIGGAVAGCTNQYLIEIDNSLETVQDTPDIFRPLLELETLAVGTRHLNVLAVYPQFRTRGIGEALVENAMQASSGDHSLIVSDANIRAFRLYERMGFRAEARRPMVKEAWAGSGEEWILMVRPAAMATAA